MGKGENGLLWVGKREELRVGKRGGLCVLGKRQGYGWEKKELKVRKMEGLRMGKSAGLCVGKKGRVKGEGRGLRLV